MPVNGSRLKEIVGMDEFSNPAGLVKALVAEIMGTLFIVFFGCMSTLTVPADQSIDIVAIAITFGSIIFVLVQAIGHVSGGHFNPAVTCSFLVVGRITIIRSLLYISAQLLGAIIGASLLKGMTPSHAIGTLGVSSIHPTLSPAQGVGVEFMLGFILLFVVFGVTDPNKPNSIITAPLAIGFTVTAVTHATIGYTSTSMNPARSLGPALIMNSWEHHWIFWLGPCAGGVTAALFYKLGFSDSSDERMKNPNPTEVSL
ncbi:Aquaporin [Nesidiocoris tenuis]|uniref:Aquaporin n=1 Tax=Nesidiocoris tenuis TaxID=355587 RepID=A0ABN7APN4_9HEMI|nr:Aquaporin [Nesidiocoris tenuis]